LTLVSGVTDQDIKTPWSASGSVALLGVPRIGHQTVCYSTPQEEYDSFKNSFPNDPLGKPCSQSATVSTLGPGDATTSCEVARSVYGSGFHQPGPDERRLMTCHATLEVGPATLFAVVSGGGTAAGTTVPGPGVVSISASTVRGAAAAGLRATKASPPIAPIKRKVKAAGVVRFSFKLSAAAKRTYSRRRALRMRLRVAFKPTGGKASVRIQRLTLRKPPPKPHVRRPPKGGRRETLFPR
jgi:hypothetical protein